LHLAAQLGDHFLRGLGEKLGEREGSEALDDGGSEDAEDDRGQQIDLVRDGDIIHEIFCGGGEDQSAKTVDDHEPEAEQEQAAARMDQGPNVGQGFPRILFLLRLRGCGGIGFRWHSCGPHRMSFLDAHGSS
jgi:hypothetical protein